MTEKDYELWKQDVEFIGMLREENEVLKKKINRAIRFIEEHNRNAGKLYYKYDGKYLLSEIKEDLLEILKD